jgi:NAD(P)-dependent dehydrogenase (short-subunit alcohol dehydrogenase family)
METRLTSKDQRTRPDGAHDQRNYVVFGGGSGIGLAVATLALEFGAAVTISDANPETARLPLLTSPSCTFALCDVTSPSQVRRVLREGGRNGDALDGVVTTVGGATIRSDLALDLEYWSRELSINLTSAYVVASAAIEAGVSSIVTTSSSFALSPGPDRIGYSAAKAGVIGLTKSLARATAMHGIRVNCVAPGLTDTPRVRRMSNSADEFSKLVQAKPQGRIATTADVAHAILFLMSDAAKSITGQVIHVNNGSFMP